MDSIRDALVTRRRKWNDDKYVDHCYNEVVSHLKPCSSLETSLKELLLRDSNGFTTEISQIAARTPTQVLVPSLDYLERALRREASLKHVECLSSTRGQQCYYDLALYAFKFLEENALNFPAPPN